MPTIVANGVALSYEIAGDGEPVVFIHGVFIASAFEPVVRQPQLNSYRRIHYARRGYAGSGPPGPTSIQQQAADCAGLMAALRIGRAHVVGHSYGGSIALQLAIAAPARVHSLTLMEPALLVGDSAAGYQASLETTMRRSREAGIETAVHEFSEMRSPGYRGRLDESIPGAFEQAVADAPTTLDYELPSVLDWRFTADDARNIRIPALAVLGEQSRQLSPRFQEAYDWLQAHLPGVEAAVIPGATHLMQVDDPAAVAAVIAAFLARHPM